MLRFPKAAIQNSKLLGVHAAPRIKVSNAQIATFAKLNERPKPADDQMCKRCIAAFPKQPFDTWCGIFDG
ncbi:hypothetical protein NBRC116597_27120 [Phaeobacter sp. NW0010-22]